MNKLFAANEFIEIFPDLGRFEINTVQFLQ